jgi:hypothetical protein
VFVKLPDTPPTTSTFPSDSKVETAPRRAVLRDAAALHEGEEAGSEDVAGHGGHLSVGYARASRSIRSAVAWYG